MVGIRTGRLELDELWAFVGCKQKNVIRKDLPVRGDQYTFIALASSAKAIIAYQTGKRHTDTTDAFALCACPSTLKQKAPNTPGLSRREARGLGGFEAFPSDTPTRIECPKFLWRVS
jgi:hypothetical protein